MTHFFPAPVHRALYRAVFHDFADGLGRILAENRAARKRQARLAPPAKTIG